MPKGKATTKLDRCATAVQKQGKSKDSSYAICNASLSSKKAKKKK